MSVSWNNILVLTGRLTRDLEVIQVGENVVGKSALAIDDGYWSKKENKWIDGVMFVEMVIWGERSVNSIKDKYKKGRLVTVNGKLEVKPYTNKNGEKRIGTSIVVGNQRLLESQKMMESAGGSQQFSPQQDFANQSYSPDDFQSIDEDGDIPF